MSAKAFGLNLPQRIGEALWLPILAMAMMILVGGAPRFRIATYLLAFAFGLSSITTALRFQAVRIRELPDEVKLTGCSGG